MSAQDQIRAMLDELMGTSRDVVGLSFMAASASTCLASMILYA